MASLELVIDGTRWTKFMAKSQKNVEKGIRAYFQKGGQLLVREQKQQAARRFGTETSQSRMRNPDPSRPKGQWAGSVRALLKGDEKWVFPDKPYDHWIEKGADAENHIPDKLRNASFIGHRPVRRSIQEGRPKLRQLFQTEMNKAIHRSVGL